jgi:uncharacterized protein (TIGR03435 family)
VKSLLAISVFALLVNAQDGPQFDVATLKLSAPQLPNVLQPINLGAMRNGTVTLTNVTLTECIQFAYSIVSKDQIAGPDWIRSGDVQFDIVGKAAPDTPQDQLRLMTQNLLADRLKLVLHREKKQLPFLALVVAKNGPKLPPAKEGVEVRGQNPGHISHPRMPMATLATLLSRFERQTVIDMTGLNGTFSVDLQWIPDSVRSRANQDGAPPLVNGQPVDPNGPSLYAALQEQLGLRLESRKGPVDVLVVDHAEKVPADN